MEKVSLNDRVKNEEIFFFILYTHTHTYIYNFHSCTVHLDIIESSIYPTDAQLYWSRRMLKLTLKFT